MKRIFGRRRWVSLFSNYIILILLAVFALGPLLFLGFNSLKSTAELAQNPIGPPRVIHLENYRNAWTVGNFATTMRNSLFLVIGTVAGTLLLVGLGAYSLARLNPPGSNIFMLYMLSGAILPIWLFLVPLFKLWRSLGLVDNLFGLMIIYIAINAPFAMFLLRSYLVELPPDFEDAARVDGANEWQVLTEVVLPLAWPGFLTVGLVVALTVWTEFQIALVFIYDPNLFPVTTSFFNFTRPRFGQDWPLTTAAGVIILAPVLAIFVALQRNFVEGLTKGGLRG